MSEAEKTLKIRAAVWGDALATETIEFWKSFSVDVEIKEIPDDVKNQPELIYKHKKEFDVAFVDPLIGEALTIAAKEVQSEVKGLGWADVLLLQQGHLWPKLLSIEALRFCIVQAAPELDSHSVGYVTGKGPLARLAAAVLIQLGFERLAILSDDPSLVETELAYMRKRYFGIEFKYLSETEMTMQPNNGSIIINTLSHETESHILEDLPYLNYIKKEGLVVDLPFAKAGEVTEEKNQLINEAEHVGMRVLGGRLVRGMRDFVLLQQICETQGFKCPIEQADYLAKWAPPAAK